MSYIGKTPTSVPLTSSDITDGIITTTKIADANVTNPKLISGSQQNFRNIIINGDMSIAQRATSASSLTSSGYHTVDRYQTSITNIGTWTQSQSTTVPTGQGFATSLKMDCTTADASPAADDALLIKQKIEGQNLQYLKKGTSSAESLTLSFWVRSNKTGTYITRLQDADNSRNISQSYTISSADTWEKKTLTFAGDTTGAFNNDNGSSLELNFWLGAGSTYTSGTLNTSWNSITDANIAVGQVNLADSTSNEWYVTGVQLEAGTTASEFEFLPFDVNRERCYRYYRTLVPLNTENTGFSMGFYTANNNGRFAMHLENPMRTTPTLDIVTGTDYFKIFTAGGGDDELNSFSIMANSTERFVIANNTSQASGTGGQAGYVQSSSNSAYLGLEAEL
tara:strand:- start:191 stop:1372 length:1182 start_codon:yes stop_codon:yes gene_type:complete